MGLFGSKKKIKNDWTDKTAPKTKQIQFECSCELFLKGSPETYSTYNDVRIGKNKLEKSLLVNTDSTKEAIKEEIAEKLENFYQELCKVIDNDETNFSEEFWKNKKEVENSNENIGF